MDLKQRIRRGEREREREGGREGRREGEGKREEGYLFCHLQYMLGIFTGMKIGTHKKEG